MLWVDRNGDGQMQADEFSFSTNAQAFGGSGWGHAFHTLTIKYPAIVSERTAVVTLQPNGYYPGGAPRYPSLTEAIAQAVPIPLLPGYQQNNAETMEDRFGNLIFNSDGEMTSFTQDGRLRWTFPNRWTGVHGSHRAPLPEMGVMQGSLFFLGRAPLDDRADVFMVNGNHGRFFVMTSDGFCLDEMFKDVRMGASIDAYLIGGECFGGFFGRAGNDGSYYLQSGHCDYRLFRIQGLEQVQRTAGIVRVSAEQTLAAANRQVRSVAASVQPKAMVITRVKKPLAIGGQDNGWPMNHVVQWNRSGKFPVTVVAAYDDRNLYLYYEVLDPSPWINHGKDWTQLFKTGDSIDLQLGTNPAADPKRREPVPGDLRLLIAPWEGKNVAVLYRHRVVAEKKPVRFVSPWRSEVVDRVEIVPDAQIAVDRDANSYAVEAAIPLAALGLQRPDGQSFAADFGVIYGDPEGTINMLRSYWSNPATGLVNDVPGEIMLSPHLWGTATFAGDKAP